MVRTILAAPEDPSIRHLAWPKIVRTPAGTLVLAYSAGVGHNKGGSGLAVSVSRDNGLAFSAPTLLCYFPRDDQRYRDMGNLAMGLGTDGSVVILCMAFSAESNTVLGWISSDDGMTWTRADTSPLGDNRTGSVYGHVFHVPGRGLAVFGHYRRPRSGGIWIAFSTDNGRTWQEPQTVSNGEYAEPAFVFAGGRLIGLVREDAACGYHQLVSDDFGNTWQFTPRVIGSKLNAVNPSPFVAADPERAGVLYALQSEREPVNAISLWTADVETLQWEKTCSVTRGRGDWTYPWMTYAGSDKWYMVYYEGSVERSSLRGGIISIAHSEEQRGAGRRTGFSE